MRGLARQLAAALAALALAGGGMLGGGQLAGGAPGPAAAQAAAPGGPTWEVDLRGRRTVAAVTVRWAEGAVPGRYRILTSLDGRSFRPADLIARAPAALKTTSFAPRGARLLRIVALGAGAGAADLEAVRAYGPPLDEAPRRRPAGADWIRGTATLLPMLDYPRRPGRPGTGLPTTDGARALGGFDALDYQGYGDGPNTRIRWVRDPLGGDETVTRFRVEDGDVASHWGGTRSELYALKPDHRDGTSAWFTWSWLLGDGASSPEFKVPDVRGLGFQNWNDGPPPQSIDFAEGVQRLIVRQVRALDGTGVEVIPFADYHRGQRQYLLMYVRFAETAAGEVRLWHSVGTPPTAGSRPAVVRRGIVTKYADKVGRAKIGLYRHDAADDAGTFPWVYDLYGYRRAPTKAAALAKWGSLLVIAKPERVR